MMLGMQKLVALLFVFPLVSSAQHQATRLYVEERIKTAVGASTHCDAYGNCYGGANVRERNVSAELTRGVMEKCPQAITMTDNREAADYVLRIAPGSSTLYNAAGDAVYVSPTRFRVKNLAKDVCGYVQTH
jgi:hypothetical protein